MKISTNRKNLILWVLISIAIITLVVMIGVTVRLFSMFEAIHEVKSEWQPFMHMIEDADVQSISVQYKDNDEFFLKHRSQVYRKALALVKDIRVYEKLFSFQIPKNTYDCGVHIYMNDGTVHTVWLNSVTRLFGHDVAYMTLDGVTYINEPWRTKELLSVIKRVIPDQFPEQQSES